MVMIREQGIRPCGQTTCPDYVKCIENFKSNRSDYCVSRLEDYGYTPGVIEDHIDIIIPALNCEDFIADALLSIANQDFDNDSLSVVVIDDGSRDDTVEVARGFKKELGRSLTIITRKFSKGPNAARNEGLEITHGAYVVFLDADSYLQSYALNYMLNGFKKSRSKKLGVVYSDYMEFVLGDESKATLVRKNNPSFNVSNFKHHNRVPVTAMVKREALNRIKLDESLVKYTGWDMWMSLVRSDITGARLHVPLFTRAVPNETVTLSEMYRSQREQVMRKHVITDLGGNRK